VYVGLGRIRFRVEGESLHEGLPRHIREWRGLKRGGPTVTEGAAVSVDARAAAARD